MLPASRHRQRGIAVLTAVLVVAIATVLAVNLLWGTSVDIQRTQSLLAQDQARLYDLGGEELAKHYLSKDGQGSGAEIDDYGEDWATHIVSQFKDGALEGWLIDQQGLFDLNSLVDAESTKAAPLAKDQFENLLVLASADLDVPVDPGTATELAEATIDWLDPDGVAELGGAEDGYYTGLQPPYVPANFWFTSISELQAVKGFTPEILRALWPHVTALPRPDSKSKRWPLNVNTATDLVLASLVRGKGVADIKRICNFEVKVETNTLVCPAGFAGGLADFTTAFEQALGVPPPAGVPLEVKSKWFLLTVTTTIGSTRSTMYSLLQRDDASVRARIRTFDAN
jgi:general secretion pathway protein K